MILRIYCQRLKISLSNISLASTISFSVILRRAYRYFETKEYLGRGRYTRPLLQQGKSCYTTIAKLISNYMVISIRLPLFLLLQKSFSSLIILTGQLAIIRNNISRPYIHSFNNMKSAIRRVLRYSKLNEHLLRLRMSLTDFVIYSLRLQSLVRRRMSLHIIFLRVSNLYFFLIFYRIFTKKPIFII